MSPRKTAINRIHQLKPLINSQRGLSRDGDSSFLRRDPDLERCGAKGASFNVAPSKELLSSGMSERAPVFSPDVSAPDSGGSVRVGSVVGSFCGDDCVRLEAYDHGMVSRRS